jgi:PTS system nitrogen regulatory IIA component
MNLQNFLKKENIFIADSYEGTDSLYADFSLFLKKRAIITDNEKVKRLFIKRENVQSTAIGRGAAAPHIFSDEFAEFIFCLALIKNGMDFKAPDEEKVYLVFLIMSDEQEVGLHLKTLAHIARLVKCSDLMEKIKVARDADQIYRIIVEEEQLV